MEIHPAGRARCVLALGFFDGQHRGHTALIRRACAEAANESIPAGVMTFDRHPGELFGAPVKLLSAPEDRAFLCKRIGGAEFVEMVPFDQSLAGLTPEQFVDRILIDGFHTAAVAVGENYTFGRNASGNAQTLRALCETRGIGFFCIPPVKEDGEPISSTRIRTLIAKGETTAAERLLGHPHLLSGLVRHGRGVGRTMDFPTANLQPDASVILPAAGVYATEAELADGRRFVSVTNVGTRPTVDRSARITVETHLIGFSEDLYGQTVRIWFRGKLREIRRFDSLRALSGQIRMDAEEAVRRSDRWTPLWTAEPAK